MKPKFSLQTIFGLDAQRERERERERESMRERKKREPRSCLRHRQRTPSSNPMTARTRSHWFRRSQHHADHTTRLDLATRSRLRPRAFNPPIFLCDFDFCCCCGGVVVVFWWLWLLIAGVCCRGLNWSFGYVWCGDLAMILKFFVIKFVWMLRK